MKEDYLSIDNNKHYEPDCIDKRITGIKNKDEAKLCKFYREKQSCPHGDTCPYTHELLRRGWLNFKIYLAKCL